MKKTWTPSVLGAILIALLTFTGVVVPATSASAAPSCYGSSCEGRNPQSTNCVNDARTLLSREARTSGSSWGILELRYSPKCYSNWTRFTPWGGLRGYFNDITGGQVDGTPYIWRHGVANSLRGRAGSLSSAGSYSVWSAMVTAAGTTCSSVKIYSTPPSSSGQGERDELGTYNAPCIS